jgi:sensor histidine kinase YesM
MEPKVIFFKYRRLWHGLFWLLLLTYEIFVWGSIECDYRRKMIISLTEVPVKIAATYATLYLIDQLLLQKKYTLFVALLLVSMVGFGLLLRVIDYHTIYPWFYPASLSIPQFFVPKILISIFAIYSIVAIVATFHLIKQWYKHQQATQRLQQTAQQLEREKLAAELQLLKSQIHPHFLFNTLNNLYVLTLQQSEKAPEIVYKLSELLSYMLYESNQPLVLLQKEIQYIENYIALEKIRYGTRLDVSLNVFSPLDSIQIAPLLILPFIENSFKHGVSNQLDQVWVRIDVLVQENVLLIKVENSKNKVSSPPGLRNHSGIGLQNVRKRLEMIYPQQYHLQLFDEEDTYLVVLKIEMALAFRLQQQVANLSN